MITDLDILSSPVVQAKLYPLRGHALHKAAGQVLFGVPEVTLETAVTGIGTKLAYARLRNRQIAEGLAAYEALTQPGHDKTANFFANLLRRGETAAPRAADQLLELQGQAMRATAGEAADVASRYPVRSVELPEYLTRNAPQELPAFQLGGAAAQRASAAPAQDVARKARPTQVMERPELPAMHQLGAEGPSLFTPRGGAAPRQPDVAPGPGPMLFGPPKGTAEAPAMFNLQEMMQRAKQAGVLRRGQDTPVTTALRDELSPEAQYGDLLSKLDFSLEAAA